MEIKLIGLVGLAGAGKSTVAQILHDQAGFGRRSFADPLKDMVASLLKYVAPQDVENVPKWVGERVWGEKKEEPIEALTQHFDLSHGQHKMVGTDTISTRHLMQTLGTEWGRKLLRSDIWVTVALARVAGHPTPIVFDDVRFQNEADAIRARGGIVVRVSNPRMNYKPGSHVSERFAVEGVCDAVIDNKSTLHALDTAVGAFLYSYGIKKPVAVPQADGAAQ